MKIGEIIKSWRAYKSIEYKKYDIRTIAKEIGVTQATLSRLENGANVDGQSMVKLMIWLFEQKETES